MWTLLRFGAIKGRGSVNCRDHHFWDGKVLSDCDLKHSRVFVLLVWIGWCEEAVGHVGSPCAPDQRLTGEVGLGGH